MPDVSQPATHPDDELVTRKILRAELANYPTKEDLRAELANYPTKEDLRAELANYSTKEDLRAELRKELTTFAADIGRQLQSMEERMIAQMAVHQDNPARLTKLEAQTRGLVDRVERLDAPKRVRRTQRKRPAKTTKTRGSKKTRGLAR